MINKLKLSLFILFLSASFLLSAGYAKAQDPIVDCWDISGKLTVIVYVQGQKGLKSISFNDTFCINSDGSFDNSLGSGKWKKKRGKYILTYKHFTLDSDLLPALPYNMKLKAKKGKATLTLNNEQLKGSSRVSGSGSIIYGGRRYSFTFTVTTKISYSYRGYSTYGMSTAQDETENYSAQPDLMLDDVVNNIEQLIWNKMK